MKRWPAFSLVETAIVLFIFGLLLTYVPVFTKIVKTHTERQEIELVLKSLGAYVAQNDMLPTPLSSVEEGDILRGYVPYKTLGIKQKYGTIHYAMDKRFTGPSMKITGFCKTAPNNVFPIETPPNDPTVLELSLGNSKVNITRNNFAAQYCGFVCQKPITKQH